MYMTSQHTHDIRNSVQPIEDKKNRCIRREIVRERCKIGGVCPIAIDNPALCEVCKGVIQ